LFFFFLIFSFDLATTRMSGSSLSAAANLADIAQTTLLFTPSNATTDSQPTSTHQSTTFNSAQALGQPLAAPQSEYSLSVRPLMTWRSDGVPATVDSLVALPFSFPFGEWFRLVPIGCPCAFVSHVIS
jgi:hypothetical protein